MILFGSLVRQTSGLTFGVMGCLMLAACQSSSKKTTSSSSEPQGMESRLLKPNMTKGNPFEKQFNTASAGDRGAMKSFGSRSFHTKGVGGLKDYGGVKSFKTGEFSQAGKESHMAKESSRFGRQSNRMGGQTFATKDSKFGGMTAHQDGKSFRDGNSVFKTSEFQPAKKSLNSNKQVYIEVGERDPSKNANAYAEDEVKRLLGR